MYTIENIIMKDISKVPGENRRLTEAICDSACISISNANGDIILVNDAFCKITGYSEDELIGSNHRLLKSDLHSNEFYNDIWSAIVEFGSWAGQVCNKKKNGENYWVYLKIQSFSEVGGSVEKYITTYNDITKQKQFEERVQRANKHLKFTHRLFEKVLHNGSIDNILKIALWGFRQNISSCSWVAVTLFDQKKDEANIICQNSVLESKLKTGTRLSLSENFKDIDTLKNGGAIYCSDIRKNDEKTDLECDFIDEGLVSYYLIPIIDNEEFIGTIIIASNLRDFLVNEIVETIEEYCYSISIAIHHSNLHKYIAESDSRLNRLLEVVNEGVIHIDANGKIQYINPKACYYFNAKAESVFNQDIGYLIKYNKLFYSNCVEYINSIANMPANNRQILLPCPIKKEVWGLLNITLEKNTGKFCGAIILITDISDSLKIEELRRRTLIEGEENERKRFAHDLHDGLGQTIAAANMYVNALENKLKGKLTDDEWEQLLKTKELVNRAVLETRTISHNIMPNSLSEFGLSQTIEEVCEDISKINEKLDIDFNTDLNGVRFDNDIELGIYRATQEIINNTLKHSKASLLQISLRYRAGTIMLHSLDNGIGMPIKNTKGLGQESLKNRIKALKGEIEIYSSKGEGTITKIKIRTKT